MLNKGFLGPIGDDLPSLIPLLFALIMFFSTFTFAFGVFDNKNSKFDSDIKVIKIAKVLKGTSYISGYENFKALCSTLSIPNLKFRAGITNYYTATDQYSLQYNAQDARLYNVGFFLDEAGNEFSCHNIDPAINSDISSSPSFAYRFFADKEIVARIYPIAVEDNRVIKPMHLVVVAWTP